MNEPVGYGVVENNRLVEVRFFDKLNSEEDCDLVPLYTSEQLHPRVKMTQAEFDEWKELFDDYEFFSDAFSQGVTIKENVGIFKKIYATKDKRLSALEIEAKFATLWANYNPDNPEETIEIIPNMKWFVKKILPNAGGNMLYYTDEGVLTYNNNKEHATKFDTKEEAEKWTNPLTEAVQLPVEE